MVACRKPWRRRLALVGAVLLWLCLGGTATAGAAPAAQQAAAGSAAEEGGPGYSGEAMAARPAAPVNLWLTRSRQAGKGGPPAWPCRRCPPVSCRHHHLLPTCCPPTPRAAAADPHWNWDVWYGDLKPYKAHKFRHDYWYQVRGPQGAAA